MKINRLRLLGFKSFVEPTELVIEPGLTGVVGPNGCGKSNLLEALRWVMGETSHKSMRAAAMDDVIFSGTNTRPERNTAEVTIFLDNSERLAPAEYNNSEVIEITRRIEREAGSAYRINGREARARDVKLLFEDASTGARSPALVRQGQIGEIVNAKPENRRRILEDAAGIAGLHTRRHEAELRLRAAEGNLERLNDVLGGLSSQAESLKRQARAARRYKEISNDIRKQDALLLHLTWADAQAAVAREEQSLTSVMSDLARVVEAESRAVVDEQKRSDALPPLREAEAARAAALGRLTIEAENLEKEEKRLTDRQRELQGRSGQLAADLAREKNFVTEAREILTRLKNDIAQLTAAEDGAGKTEADIRKRLDAAETTRKTTEDALSEITHKVADARARMRALEANLKERREQVEKIDRQIAGLDAQTREIAGRAPDAIKLTETAELGQRLVQQIAGIETQTLAAEEKAADLQALAKARREEAQQARLKQSALKTERETLMKLLVLPRDGDVPPIVDSLRVAKGFETALGAALGDDLDAPAAEEAPVHWRKLAAGADDSALPAGAEPLILHVKGPAELTRRLRQIGVVPAEDGQRLQGQLKPGQRLVSKAGDLWRWDGFVAAAGGATAAAQRLAERNRLADIEQRELDAYAAAKTLLDADTHAASAAMAGETEERRLRQLWRDTQTKLAETRDALTKIERAARETEAKLAAVAGAKVRSEDDLNEAEKRLFEVTAALDAEKRSEDLEPKLTAAHHDAEVKRKAVGEIRGELLRLESDRRIRGDMLRTATAEDERWTTRCQGAGQQITTLETRHKEAMGELETLAKLPADVAAKRQKLFNEIQKAETERKTAADYLAAAETAVRVAVQALRAAQGQVTDIRENRARTDARLESSRQRRQDEARRIRETLGCAPDGCLVVAEMQPGAGLPTLDEVDRQLAKLKTDRERLGGVNLAADEELTAIADRLSSMEKERDDVDQAISKLRGAINQLNREAKSRLEEAFNTVNRHFQRLFTTLFEGGEARLEMIESVEDPLEGGLEIIAKPPGKKPATLSLLSGGEQSLTALSLIFAVFLTNPSPICVLDEVDAPLDDSNVDRFCRLMESMSADTDTRFLVITHHPMTMARMNRLFGVTMAEKGLSQLVSVDLETAQRFREAS